MSSSYIGHAFQYGMAILRQRSFLPLQSAAMESLFTVLSLVLFAAAIIAYAAIVRDVMPHLAPEHRSALRHLFLNTRLREVRAGEKAIGTAWQAHSTLFQTSRKRMLFAGLFIAATLSVFCYPIWICFR